MPQKIVDNTKNGVILWMFAVGAAEHEGGTMPKHVESQRTPVYSIGIDADSKATLDRLSDAFGTTQRSLTARAVHLLDKYIQEHGGKLPPIEE